MVCQRCQVPITKQSVTGYCQPCAVSVTGARSMQTHGAKCGASGRAKRIWNQKAKDLWKRLEGR